MSTVSFWVTRESDGKRLRVEWRALEEPFSDALARAGVPRLAWHHVEIDAARAMAQQNFK